MAFDWTQYMNLAVELRKNKDEAYQRSAISRGYYSAFNVARLYLEAKQRPIDTDNHLRLWSQVLSVSGSTEIHSMGKRARELRNRADYDGKIEKLDDAVGTAMNFSARIIYLIGKLDRTPAPVLPGSGLSNNE